MALCSLEIYRTGTFQSATKTFFYYSLFLFAIIIHRTQVGYIWCSPAERHIKCFTHCAFFSNFSGGCTISHRFLRIYKLGDADDFHIGSWNSKRRTRTSCNDLIPAQDVSDWDRLAHAGKPALFRIWLLTSFLKFQFESSSPLPLWTFRLDIPESYNYSTLSCETALVYPSTY